MLAQLTPTNARLVRQSGGYRLEVDPDLVDVHRFRDLVGRAHHLDGADPEKAVLLSAALGLWRGEPLAGLDGPWVAQVREAWRHQHLDATLDWARAQLRIGKPAEVIEPLIGLAGEHPLVEPATALLMRALSLTGREAEALDRYARTRQRLIDELGAEPGADLREVHQAILRGELARSRPDSPASGTPRQLPLSARGFAGRGRELARLDVVLVGADEQPAAVTIVAVSGLAGVGKTALAVHWARRVADRFPDGQLYVNLRGFDPSGLAVSPAEAVRGFLDALEMPPHRIPARLDAQIALYRSLAARRRVLVLLDNARDADQVRPLLPGSPGCLVVVTSRDQLSGLTAAEGAHPVVLNPLPASEARQLLAHRLGEVRVAAEPDAVDEIIVRCGRLPLALAVAAARAANHPDFALAAVAEELRDAAAILDVLASSDPTTDIRTVFSWSYTTRSAEAARLFRLLALHPGPQIGTSTAASLAGTSIARVRPLLAELARAHLMIEHLPGRFTFHDLLRAFATERMRTLDTETEQRSATHRMLDHYLLTAHAADALLKAHRVPIFLVTAAADVCQEELTTAQQALSWFAREHAALLGVFHLAVTAELDTHAWQLARTLSTFHLYRGHWHDQIAVQRIALAAAQRLGNRSGQAHARHDLGHVYVCLGRYDEAHAQLTRAADLYRTVGNPNGEASAHYFLGSLAGERDDGQDALHHARLCGYLYRVAGDRAGEARALNALGLAHTLNGRHREALAYCQRAVDLHRDLGNHRGEAAALDSLGHICARLGQRRQFIAWYRQALARLRDVGDRFGESKTLTNFGDAYRSHGDIAAATEAWTQALAILDEFDHPDAEVIRSKLRDAAGTVA